MAHPFFVVANSKTYFSYQQIVQFIAHHRQDFINLTSTSSIHIVLCPPILALPAITQMLFDSNVYFGAQNCSAFDLGAHTGDIDAQSLQHVGATYCIVGHSERRIEHYESNEIVAAKAQQAVKHGLQPIVCVGETEEERAAGNTYKVINRQITIVLQALINKNVSSLIIAYEPVWAIGNDRKPTNTEIETVFNAIQIDIATIMPNVKIHLFYGGSVDEHSVENLLLINNLGGFLIGRASLDFQKFQKIVTCVKDR